MNYKKVFKRETKVIAYVVIALTLVVIGSSYALFMQVKNNSKNQIVKAGSLEITYSSSNDTNGQKAIALSGEEGNCLMPMSDEDGKEKGCDFKLSIQNTGTLPMLYDLLIYDNESNNNDLVNHTNLKHQLIKQVVSGNVKATNGSLPENTTSTKTVTDAKLLSGLGTKSGDSNKKILESSTIKPGETIAFDLKIWVIEDAEEDIVGKKVNLKLDVSGVVAEGDTLAKTIENIANDNSVQNRNVEIFKHTPENGIATISEIDDLNEYRYTGTNPNNYVYFGCTNVKETDEGENITTCTEENLYRIIGIVPMESTVNGVSTSKVKIVKDTYLTSVDNTSAGTKNNLFEYAGEWAESNVYQELEKYWTSLGEFQKYVVPSVLYFGDFNSSDNYTPNILYNTERKDTTGILSNVGLMYPSDYGYSLGNSSTGQAITAGSNSWLKATTGAQGEWLLSSPGEKALSLKTDGSIGTDKGPHAIRPTLYLQENVYVNGGNGTKTDPYILEFR